MDKIINNNLILQTKNQEPQKQYIFSIKSDDCSNKTPEALMNCQQPQEATLLTRSSIDNSLKITSINQNVNVTCGKPIQKICEYNIFNTCVVNCQNANECLININFGHKFANYYVFYTIACAEMTAVYSHTIYKYNEDSFDIRLYNCYNVGEIQISYQVIKNPCIDSDN
jgi:hypothetical protein